jgi:hypothetical protein
MDFGEDKIDEYTLALWAADIDEGPDSWHGVDEDPEYGKSLLPQLHSSTSR